MANEIAKDGQIWVCSACGKSSRDKYGIEGKHSDGWDESCMLNSVLCVDDKPPLVAGIDHKWKAVTVEDNGQSPKS